MGRGVLLACREKGERSLVDGDEFQSLRERSRTALALCEVVAFYVAV